MRETWLRSNLRVLWPFRVVGAVGIVAGLALVMNQRGGPAMFAGGALVAAGLLLGLVAQYAFGRPRLAYEPGHLLLYVRRGAPVRLPIAVVEGFLLGQGPSYLPGKHAARLDTSTLVLKLAERYPEWAQVECRPTLASWCNHYVTIRGTWCEPLNVERVNRLNARLAEVSRPAAPQGAA